MARKDALLRLHQRLIEKRVQLALFELLGGGFILLVAGKEDLQLLEEGDPAGLQVLLTCPRQLHPVSSAHDVGRGVRERLHGVDQGPVEVENDRFDQARGL